MPVVIHTQDQGAEWSLWNEDPDGGWRANFYTPSEPYLRHCAMVDATAMAVRYYGGDLRASVEAKMRREGWVTFDELPGEAQRYWGRADMRRLLDDLTEHLEGRE